MKAKDLFGHIPIILGLMAFGYSYCDEQLLEQGCPCLPAPLCPRILGSHPNDEILLNQISNCTEENYVRCCGVSVEISLKQEENQTNINNDIDLRNNSVITIIPEYKKPRKPKSENNVSLVYPSEMSGLPQTTPTNLNENQMMMMMDEETGDKTLVVFSEAGADEESKDNAEKPKEQDQINNSNSTEKESEYSSITEETPINYLQPSEEPFKTTTFKLIPETSTVFTIKSKFKKNKKRRKYRPNQNSNKPIPTTTTTPLISLTELQAMRNKLLNIFSSGQMKVRNHEPTTKTPNITQDDIKTEKYKEEINEEFVSNRIGRNRGGSNRFYDPSSRRNFLRRPSKPEPITTTESSTLRPLIDEQLKIAVDTDHKIMIEHVHSALSDKSNNLHDNQEISRSIGNVKLSEKISNIERNVRKKMNEIVHQMIDIHANLKYEEDDKIVSTTSKPFRGNLKYSIPVWKSGRNIEKVTTTTMAPPTVKRGRVRPTPTTTSRPTTVPTKEKKHFVRNPKHRRTFQTTTTTTLPTKTTATTTLAPTTTTPETTTIETILETTSEIQPLILTIQEQVVKNGNETYPSSLPFHEFQPSNNPLLADFKPSPLWTLNADDIIPKFNVNEDISERQARTIFQQPDNLQNGFIPVIHNGESLSIIGHIPSGFKVLKDSSKLDYELPPPIDDSKKFSN